MKLRGILSGLLLMTILYGCGLSCPPAPANPMLDSPFRGYRLGALVIETADSPSEPFSREILDTEYDLLYRPRNYPQAAEIVRDAFSKPGDERYADAPAVHMLCSMETVTPSALGLLDNQSARFVGKVSIVDPSTKRSIAVEQCDFDAAEIPNAAKEKCGQRGLPGLSDVIHQCLRQFTSEMKSSTLKKQPTQGALIDGTFIGVVGDFTPNAPTAFQRAISSPYKKADDEILRRFITYELPTYLSKSFVNDATFSSSVANTYGISIDVHNSNISSGIFTSTTLRYTAITTILKNGKPVGSFTFDTQGSELRKRFEIYASHTQAILGYLREHAAELNKR